MRGQRLVHVRLYGHLRARFGVGHRLAVATPAEAVRALCAVVPGFEAYVRQHSEPGYRVVVGTTPIAADEELHHPLGARIIRLVPVVAGAGSGGKILGGVALIALAFFTGGAGLSVMGAYASGGIGLAASAMAFNIGVSMVIGGVSQMLAGTPKVGAGVGPSERPNNQPSFVFNGAVNTVNQGNPVSVCYGRLRVGSQVISTGLSTAQIA